MSKTLSQRPASPSFSSSAIFHVKAETKATASATGARHALRPRYIPHTPHKLYLRVSPEEPLLFHRLTRLLDLLAAEEDLPSPTVHAHPVDVVKALRTFLSGLARMMYTLRHEHAAAPPWREADGEAHGDDLVVAA